MTRPTRYIQGFHGRKYRVNTPMTEAEFSRSHAAQEIYSYKAYLTVCNVTNEILDEAAQLPALSAPRDQNDLHATLRRTNRFLEAMR